MSIGSMMLSNHLILWQSLLLLPLIFPSIKVLSNELALDIRWQKCWIFSISPSNEHSRLILFRIDWFYLLAVQGIFSLSQEPSPASQFESINISTLRLLYGSTLTSMTTRKTIALTIWTSVNKLMSQQSDVTV